MRPLTKSSSLVATLAIGQMAYSRQINHLGHLVHSQK